jgi:hypothetical protein
MRVLFFALQRHIQSVEMAPDSAGLRGTWRLERMGTIIDCVHVVEWHLIWIALIFFGGYIGTPKAQGLARGLERNLH